MPEPGEECNAIAPTGRTDGRTGASRGRIPAESFPPFPPIAAPARPPATRSAPARPHQRCCRRPFPRGQPHRLYAQPRTTAVVFGQLPAVTGSLGATRTNTCATCGSTMRRDAGGVRRSPAATRRTSQ